MKLKIQIDNTRTSLFGYCSRYVYYKNKYITMDCSSEHSIFWIRYFMETYHIRRQDFDTYIDDVYNHFLRLK